MIPQLKSLLLPPVIRERLRAKTDSDSALPINLSTNVIERLKKDPVRAERLSELAADIWDHLEVGEAGWGSWPLDTEDALVVSMLLSVQLEHAVSQSILNLSEDEMAFVEQQSQEQGLSLEQILINSIVERVEGQR